MPVRNALPYLDAAVESILGQTYPEFDFVIRDDASTDGTSERLRFWAAQDSRIRLFEGETSLGPAESSNFVVRHAATPLIARMDADDIAHPDRLRQQIEVLSSRPDVVLVGSTCLGIDHEGKVVREADLAALFQQGFAAPFAHGSIMVRRDAFERAGGYRRACDFWEDLDLFVRLARLGRVLVIPRSLYRHRFSDTSTRLTSAQARVEGAVDMMFRCRRAAERGEDYEAILRDGPLPADSEKLHPNVFLSLGFISLWAGGRPGTLRRMLARGDLKLDADSVRALIWAGWAHLSPRMLRAFMRLCLLLRNRRVRGRLVNVETVEWRQAQPAHRPSTSLTPKPIAEMDTNVAGDAAKLDPASAERMIEKAGVLRFRDEALAPGAGGI